MTSLESLKKEFSELTGLKTDFDKRFDLACGSLVKYFQQTQIRTPIERQSYFISLINKKFKLNAEVLSIFFEKAASAGKTFNYHQKNAIQESFDQSNQQRFLQILKEWGLNRELIEFLADYFKPISKTDTLHCLVEESSNPTKLRVEKGGRDIGSEISKSAFAAYLWVSLPEEKMHAFFDPDYSTAEYSSSFWKQLQIRSPHLFNRKSALRAIKIDLPLVKKFDTYRELQSFVFLQIEKAYKEINNYGFFAVLINPVTLSNKSIEWELVSDILLFSEKFNEYPLNKNYFQWQKVKEQTESHIRILDSEDAAFHLVNEGFTYRDTFVINDKKGDVCNLLLIFQKNERDETPIPCPACRSLDVQGNSYPSLGVRSWECNNPLCPDRSKYNRGKRYSFKALLMQESIEDELNVVPKPFVRKWQRDVVEEANERDICEMLLRHYSINGDSVQFYNWKVDDIPVLGREISELSLDLKEEGGRDLSKMHLFKRYIKETEKKPEKPTNIGDDRFQVFNGDAARVLRSLPRSSIDGAVTSPPYYNAREYSQWSNMYCYLHDMFDINTQVFKTLKPGAIYLYNIFDYFDNENTVAFSAMAQKRLILSAYTVDLFRRIGFEMIGNIVWDKGDIEGKRGFNAGNFSPFYQAPFNCWEHILVFRKPDTDNGSEAIPDIKLRLSKVFRCKPVIKMIKGKNTYGHTAPFPEQIPMLLTRLLPKGSVVLDPFAGSMTTGRVAERDGHVAVCIEQSEDYCRLGLEMRSSQQSLFEAEENLQL